jgi:DNA topoisomerase IA
MKLTVQAIDRWLIDPGFRRVYQPHPKTTSIPSVLPEGISLAKLKKGDHIKPRQVRVRCEKNLQPGITEGTLIHAMQTHGIGRPSTYASTIKTLIDRGYVTRGEQGELASTLLGRQVCNFLIHRFPELFSIGFTAQMEAKLDAITEGRTSYAEVLQLFWKKLPRQKEKIYQ